MGERPSPIVTLDNASVTGISSGAMNAFLGIPFAQPPFSANAYGPACPQESIELPIVAGLPAETLDCLTNTIFDIVTPSAEDCLTLNIVAPADATPDSKLPVVAWIYGGGCEIGGTQRVYWYNLDNRYDGSIIVEKAISVDVPTIYVRMNYW
ncbi:hypothetical protein PAXINDRAFT_82070 [Paxillus involutus ATCC 200175]|uniref:Carboxylesterase type B domain-containing protein n=1 Tax=Paxillus involutus ATCC 200175 TaxID=664439 RepID=A0A0C9TR36_PAXIN|nr:hypothetical protein PAXINDRAFT_82070 [Paxillus involutus ATCC 200175]